MLSLLIFSLAHAACPDFAEPRGDWGDATASAAAAAPSPLAALEAYAFPAVMDEKERTGVRTDGLVIVRDGEILYERYGRDWTADKPHLLWSASKSVSATLLGMAVQDGLLDVDASICDTIDVAHPDSCTITTRNLMEFASGFAWRETYEGTSPTASSVVGMLYGAGMDNSAAFVSGHPLRDVPGTSYSYSSGDTVLQTAVAHKLLKEKSGENYLQERLYGPLGITSAEFETDRTGLPIGSSSLYLTPRDMARYGALLIQDGCFGGERLLPEGWMARATSPASVLDGGKLVDPPSGPLPGWNLWLNRVHPAVNDGKLAWADVPEGVYGALGHWKQAVYVFPEHGVVVARTGDDRDGTFKPNDFLPLVVAFVEAVPETVPPAPPPAPAPDRDTTGDTGIELTEELPPPEPPPPPGRPGLTPAAFPPPPMPAIASTGAQPPDKYDVGLLSIGTSFAAMHACACRYTSERSEDACISYIRISPDIARVRYNDETQTVTAKAFGMAKTRARPGPEGRGCQIVE